MLQVCLYTTRGCRSCDAVSPMLRELSQEFAFELEAVDIAGDPELQSRFGYSIPIVTVDGGNQVAGRVTPERLRAALSRALERRRARAAASSSSTSTTAAGD